MIGATENRRRDIVKLNRNLLVVLTITACLATIGSTSQARERVTAQAAFEQLQQEYPNVHAYGEFGRVTRLYGQSFGAGSSPELAADRFRTDHTAVFGAEAEDLLPVSLLADGRHTQGVMYNEESDEYKFTLVYYTQFRDGIPVFRSDLRVLVRNIAGYPVVLASSSLQNLGDERFAGKTVGSFELAKQAAMAEKPGLLHFTEPTLVIWAGYDEIQAKPTLAMSFTGYGDNGEKMLFVADNATGEILFQEDRIIFENMQGSVKGYATEGTAAEHCEEEVLMPLKHARVSIGSNYVYTNNKGGFSIPAPGISAVMSEIRGQWFRVWNNAGAEAVLVDTAAPPGYINFVHNPTNTEHVRAQVNGYIQSDKVRDLVIKHNPSYPAVSSETEFPVYVNRNDGYCPGNAWYDDDDQSINFCLAAGGYPNTAWAPVVHHEYGHRLVNAAGSGQGQYGEGMGDVMALLLADESGAAFGFYGDCDTPLRDANNTIVYPCGGEIHYCGQLLSGCVWSIRNQLVWTYPVGYLDTLANLAVNAMLVHTGNLITPQIAIDYLTLDDDDANLDNGTPNYFDICDGFAAHGMDCPTLTPIWFEFPNGIPEIASPAGTTTFPVIVNASIAAPIEGTGKIYYRINGGSWQQGTMTQTSPNHYDAQLPGGNCLDQIDWYVTADATGWGTIYNPSGAPVNHYTSYVATNAVTLFQDDFETATGWVSSGGSWARGVPTGGGGEYGSPDPTGGHNAPNVLGYNLNGDYEDNMPERNMTSPVFNCTDKTNVHLKFWRWLGVEQPSYDHAYVKVSTNGSTWTTIWQNDSEVADAAWTEVDLDLSQYADDQATVYVRFTMGMTDGSYRYCGWNVDDLRVTALVCDVMADSDSDGIPDATDNCPSVSNPLQEDADGDGIGNVCDACTDTDNDGFGNPGYPANTCPTDNCPTTSNPTQADADGDGLGDACDACTDTDGDGFANPGFPASTCPLDNCPSWPNPYQEDLDTDAVGDSCDNCLSTPNPDQADSDQDGIGDVCEWVCGEFTGGVVDIDDAVFLITYIFGGGPAPNPIESADVDCSGGTPDIDDVVYLIQYIFADGPAPCAECK
jgi:hypothetical protein